VSGSEQNLSFISLSQPWLWSILSPIIVGGAKRIENRKWMPPIHMIGKRIALHAAKSFDEDAIGFFIRNGIDNFPNRFDSYESSAILGVATIDRVVTEDRTLPEDQKRWFFGPCGWVLIDVIPFVNPLPMKGAQGLRKLEDDMNKRVLDEVELSIASFKLIGRTA
jgi:hypothetical protein